MLKTIQCLSGCLDGKGIKNEILCPSQVPLFPAQLLLPLFVPTTVNGFKERLERLVFVFHGNGERRSAQKAVTATVLATFERRPLGEI